MASFQSTLLIIATVVLIIILVLFAYTLHKGKQNQTWPPITGDCPDYWIDGSGNGAMCQNTLNLGTCKTAPDFTGATYTSSSTGGCAKQQWANACGVTWDGITYGYGESNPCAPPSSSSKGK
jgi:hypothetical protein